MTCFHSQYWLLLLDVHMMYLKVIRVTWKVKIKFPTFYCGSWKPSHCEMMTSSFCICIYASIPFRDNLFFQYIPCFLKPNKYFVKSLWWETEVPFNTTEAISINLMLVSFTSWAIYVSEPSCLSTYRLFGAFLILFLPMI